MKPEGKKSPQANPAANANLAVLMKQRIKPKEKHQPGKSARKSLELLSSESENIFKTSTSRATRAGRLTRQSATSSLHDMPGNANGNVCLTRPLVHSTGPRGQQESGFVRSDNKFTAPRANPMTPKIMITKCSKLEKLVENTDQRKGKTVPRSKVKSPAMSKAGRSEIKNIKGIGNVGREKLQDYEQKLKTKELEILRLNRKLNSIQKTLNDKERVVKSLEMKIPKMLSELKNGLNEEKKVNVGLRETLKKNKQLLGANKHTEEQLRIKDDKIKELTNSKKLLMEDLKAKDLELSEFRLRLETLEKKLPCYIDQIKFKDTELEKFKESIEFLEERLVFQSEENKKKEDEIVDLNTQLKELSDELLEKDNELIDVKANNYAMNKMLMEQYRKMEAADSETKNYLNEISNVRGMIENGQSDIKVLQDSMDCLDKATEDFLDKVSAMSREKSMSLNVKLTVKRQQKGGSVKDKSSERQSRYLVRPVSIDNNNSSGLNFNSIKHSSFRNSGNFESGYLGKCERFSPNLSYDEVFVGSSSGYAGDDKQMSRYSNADSSMAASEASRSRDAIDVSSDTCTRLDELDNKVRSLWTKLSTRDETFEEFKSDKKEMFTKSVDRLKIDLSESVDHHNKFLTKVCVAKKLFSSPTPAQ